MNKSEPILRPGLYKIAHNARSLRGANAWVDSAADAGAGDQPSRAPHGSILIRDVLGRDTARLPPGGNITGGAVLTGEMAAKRLELLKEVVPSLSRTAVLWNSANPANALAWRETQGAARALGVTLQSHEVQGPKDFEIAFARTAEERPDALFVLDDALTIQYRKEIADFAM
jgi:putative tryptophan/tyrosine transport system substrate-binding protein